MILGNMLQQLYNVADTLIVGRYIGSEALASVGTSFTLMTFLTSILLGLCMGSSVFFSMCYGAGDEGRMKEGIFVAFVLIAVLTLILNIGTYLFLDPILGLLRVPAELYNQIREYLEVVLLGMCFTFLCNFFTSLLRALGNSVAPLLFLGVSTLLNIGLDLLFVLNFGLGVAGAAWATVIAQGVSAACIVCYALRRASFLVPARRHLRMRAEIVRQIFSFSFLTCLQQSVMNLGILMIQGLVNNFGADAMAAFAAAVKIDAFAYMPVQDFGNAFSTFIAQNHGARKAARIRLGIRSASLTAFVFCVIVSAFVFFLAQPLIEIFIDPAEVGVVAIGVEYLRIEGACYCGIGCLFLLYGLYRGLARPDISVVLTVVSLGVRVALAYLLAPIVGLPGIWWAIPIGWILADTIGLLYYRARRNSLLSA
ncbi:MATE efflux family protein [[Clostridium] methylpentosum DSM 5476]|uniref:Probable multidrug resistance protein NorM n=1 Tax=[Clostridium] methylpentosum DSM 5476 TaxID=537013 RepID=C0EGM2_9FIRM|nr:MATE efflux family protein [[Clostridium] methylpentosum DSM 5476]